MTISKEERTEWRIDFENKIKSYYGNLVPATLALRLLDALEAAEARAEELQHQVFEHEHNANFAEGVANSALARAEAAERDRDALAVYLLGKNYLPCDDNGDCPKVDETTCTNGTNGDCWLEWARQQARGGEI